jgi:hypothetical protein
VTSSAVVRRRRRPAARRDGGDGEQRVQQQPGPARDPAGRLGGGRDARVDHADSSAQRRIEEGLPERGPDVVAGGDALLHRGSVLGPGDLLGELAPGDLTGQRAGDEDRPDRDQREQQPGRPPGQARRPPTSDRPAAACGRGPSRCGAAGRPSSCVSSSTRSSTSPTACSDSTDNGWCSAASSRSLRSRPSARSTTAHQAARRRCPAPPHRPRPGEQDDEQRSRPLGQPPGDHRAAGLADRRHRSGGQRPPGGGRAHARETHVARRRGHRRVERRRRCGAVEEGHLGLDATAGDGCRRPRFPRSGGSSSRPTGDASRSCSSSDGLP